MVHAIQAAIKFCLCKRGCIGDHDPGHILRHYPQYYRNGACDSNTLRPKNPQGHMYHLRSSRANASCQILQNAGHLFVVVVVTAAAEADIAADRVAFQRLAAYADTSGPDGSGLFPRVLASNAEDAAAWRCSSIKRAGMQIPSPTMPIISMARGAAYDRGSSNQGAANKVQG